MTDSERLEIMLEYVAGTLDASQAESVRQALHRHDPAWAAALAEAETTMAAYASAIMPIAPPADAKSKLMTQITRLQIAGREAPADTFKSIRRFAQAFTGIAALLLIAILVNGWTNHKVDVALDKAAAEHAKAMQASQAQIVMLNDRINREGKLIQALHSTSLKVVDLGSDKSKAIGRILVDESKNEWHLFTTALAPLASDKTYELWYITPDQRKIAGPTFVVDVNGDSMISVSVPKDIGPIAIAAITDEPAGGVQVPTGSIRLVGKMQ